MPAAAQLVELNQANWDREVPTAPVPVVAVFWADWCVPCRTLLPRVDDASTRWGGQVRFGMIDVDVSPQLVKRYGIVGLPTVLLLREGAEVTRRVGLVSAETLEALISQQVGAGR